MQLTLVRHAIAEDGPDDFARPLSQRGRKRFKQVVRGLDDLGVRFSACLHSPRVRALETAELLADLVDGSLSATPLLAEAPSPALLEALRGEHLVVVGHEPHLSRLLAWLTTGAASGGEAFELKKGAVAQLEGTPTPGGMRLVALLPPRLFR
jgi:phosphohistidine phosphatase